MHVHKTLIPGRTRAQPSLKKGRGEGGRTLKHGLHPGFSWWDQQSLRGITLTPRDPSSMPISC